LKAESALALFVDEPASKAKFQYVAFFARMTTRILSLPLTTSRHFTPATQAMICYCGALQQSLGTPALQKKRKSQASRIHTTCAEGAREDSQAQARSAAAPGSQV